MPDDIPIKYPKEERPPLGEGELGEVEETGKGKISQEKLEKIEAERYGEVLESEVDQSEEVEDIERGSGAEVKTGRPGDAGAASAEDIEKAIGAAREKFGELKEAPPSKENEEELERLKENTRNEFKKLAHRRDVIYAMEVAKETGSAFIMDVAHDALAEEQNKSSRH